MLSVILMILKIIGIVLLVILGIILIIVLSVLLVPVRYSLSGDYHEQLKASAGVSWFLHLISVMVDYDGSLDYTVRLFGIPLIKSDSGKEEPKEVPKSEKPEEPKETSRHEEREKPKENLKQEKPEESKENLKQEKPEEPKKTKKLEEHEEPEEALKQEEIKKPEKPRKAPKPEEPGQSKGTPEQENIIPVLTDWIENIESSFKNLYKRIISFKDLVSDPVNQKSFKLMIRQAKAIIKHILPTKLKGDIAFGFDDPATTGNVLCICSLIYALYGEKLVFTPVFDDTVTEGDIAMSGRIRIGTLIVLSVRLLLDKNIRTRLMGMIR